MTWYYLYYALLCWRFSTSIGSVLQGELFSFQFA